MSTKSRSYQAPAGRVLQSGTAESKTAKWWPPIRLPLVFAAVYLAQGTFLRLVLWGSFGSASGVSAGLLPMILTRGLAVDIQIAACLILPLLAFSALMPRSWLARPTIRAFVGLVSFAFLFGLIYLAFVEYFFFEEFDQRFNIVAVDYLIYPHEVLINIWESYPVLPVLLVTFLVTALLLRALWPAISGSLSQMAKKPHPRATATMILGACLVTFLPSLGDNYGGENRVAGELADNGLRTFFLALRTSEIDFRSHYPTGDPEVLSHALASWLDPAGAATTEDMESSVSESRSPSFHQVEAAPGRKARSPNIVLVLEESFGAEFIGAYGDSRGLTPEFDALAQRGLLFRNAYATGTRTVRGIEAVLASFPPIPTVSIVKRPGSENIATLGGTLGELGYRRLFLYGGYGYFDNMNHFFSSNGFEIRDRSSLPEPKFANIWGVSDEDLFSGALESFDNLAAEKDAKPFFGVVLTTSNHKPYTFPEGVPGVAPEGGGRNAGVRYADHALGRFIREAEAHSWAANTLFVIVADHGARVYGSAQIPLRSYEIPLLFLWPGQLEAGVVDEPVSQIDIAPTVLGLLGQPYAAPFFGRDVLGEDPRKPLLLFNHNHDVALLSNDEIVILGLHQKVSAFRYAADEERYTPLTADPNLVQLTVAVYQIADDLFHRHAYR